MIETEKDQETEEMEERKSWLVGKLLTNRLFNKEAMLSTLKVVWKISRNVKVTVLESNLFIFKFASLKDKQRVIDGSPWSFNKNLVVFKDYNGDLRGLDYKFETAQFWVRVYGFPLRMLTKQCATIISSKLGELIQTNIGNSDFLRLQVNMDVTKPLRKFITVTGGVGKGEIWGRLGYERLLTFCYECGVIGHNEYKCEQAPVERYESNTKQYGD